jgi:Putative zinc-finger
MNGEKKNRMQCAEFEAMLTDALDGMLGEADESRFQAHLAVCSNCAPLFNEAQLGLKWLSALKEDEAEPPARMVENILRATIGTSPIPKAAKETKPWWERLKETPVFGPIVHTVFQPRFAMGFGMAFFSITMLLNVAGVQLKNIRYIDLRPSAIVTTYYETTGKIVKYWENIRFVYKIESNIRDLKKAATEQKPDQNNAPQTDQQKPQDQNKNKNRETSKVHDQDGRVKNEILAKATVDQVEGNGQRLQAPGQRRSL